MTTMNDNGLRYAITSAITRLAETDLRNRKACTDRTLTDTRNLIAGMILAYGIGFDRLEDAADLSDRLNSTHRGLVARRNEREREMAAARIERNRAKRRAAMDASLANPIVVG